MHPRRSPSLHGPCFALGLCLLVVAPSSRLLAIPCPSPWQSGIASTGAPGDPTTVLDALNAARTSPAVYATRIAALRPRFDGLLLRQSDGPDILTQEGLGAVDEAVHALEAQAPLPALSLSSGLTQAADDHLADQASTGTTGHTGRDGSTPSVRMGRHGRWLACCGENVAYGFSTPQEVVLQLIVDDGVRDRGHRKNMFSDRFTRVGIALGSHPKWRTVCVMDFAGGFEENP